MPDALKLTGAAPGLERRALAAAVMETLGQKGPLAAEIEIVSPRRIRLLNRTLRGVDAVTDVLSFPALDGIRDKVLDPAEYPLDCEGGRLMIGSIAICARRAAEQAAEYGHSERRELHYLAVHGLMHLFGYDHEEEADRAVMRAKEEAVLSRLDIGRTEE